MDINFENSFREILVKIADKQSKLEPLLDKAAELESSVKYLEEMKKTILAQGICSQDLKLSFAEREARARITEVFMVHLQAIRDQSTDLNRNDAQINKIKGELNYLYLANENLRSLCSREAAKLKSGVDFSQGG